MKSPDGQTMAIKASGTALTAMSESAGWVEVNVAAVLSIFDRNELATMETDAREARVLQHLSSAIVGGKGRPSVETALHAMLGKSSHSHASRGRQRRKLRAGLEGAGRDHAEG